MDNNKIFLKRILKEELVKLKPLFPGKDDKWISYYEERLKQFNENDVDIYVIELDNFFIGEITVNYSSHNLDTEAIKNKRVYLEAFRIKKEYQKQGLGQKLLDYAISDLKEKGYTEFTVGVEDDNEVAKHIYFKLGFTKEIDKGHGNKYDPSEYTLYLKKC